MVSSGFPKEKRQVVRIQRRNTHINEKEDNHHGLAVLRARLEKLYGPRLDGNDSSVLYARKRENCAL